MAVRWFFRQFGEGLLDFFGKFAVQHIICRKENSLVLVLPLRLVLMFAMRFFGATLRDAASGGGFRSGTDCARW